MKRNALLPVFCLLLIGLTIQACKKRGRHVYIDQELIKNFDYKVGSYWIYRDSISGRVDSFFITDNLGVETTDNNDINVDHIGIHMKENSNVVSTDTITWYWSLQINVLSLGWYVNDFNGALNTEYGIFISYPFNLGIPIEKGNFPVGGITNVTVNNIDSIYILNGSEYKNVAEISQTFNSIDSLRFNDWFCFNVDAGIIKMRLDHPHFLFKRVWELQRYHIVK